jgi:hypothetical protein
MRKKRPCLTPTSQVTACWSVQQTTAVVRKLNQRTFIQDQRRILEGRSASVPQSQVPGPKYRQAIESVGNPDCREKRQARSIQCIPAVSTPVQRIIIDTRIGAPARAVASGATPAASPCVRHCAGYQAGRVLGKKQQSMGSATSCRLAQGQIRVLPNQATSRSSTRRGYVSDQQAP